MKSTALLLFLAFSAIAHGAGPSPDYAEMYRRAYSGKNDTASINALILFTKKHIMSCNDSVPSGIRYAMDARNRSLKINYVDGIVQSNILVGDVLRFLKDFSSATEYYFQALKVAEENGSSKAQGAYLGLGLIYLVQERWDEAIIYFSKVQSVMEAEGAKPNSRPPYLIGYCQNKLGRYSEAKASLDKALLIAMRGNQNRMVNEISVALANSLSGLGKYDEALKLFNSLNNEMNKLDDPIGFSHVYLGMAQTYHRMNNPAAAMDYAGRSHNINLAKLEWALIRESSSLLAEIYHKAGNHAKAFEYLKEHLRALDTMSKRDVLPKIAVSQARLEFKRTEDRMNEELLVSKQKRLRLNLMLGFSGLILVVMALAFISVRRERQKSENLLLNILPQETAQELKKTGKVIPRMHRGVSIMFCDFVGFTRIIENLSPEQLVRILDHYFSGFDEIMEKYGIEKIKTIGDAYMCVAGLNGEHDHAVKMVQACRELVDFVGSSLHRFDDVLTSGFNIRVGIHSGTVVSGVVGKHKYAFDIWGDDVNVAARMEQRSEPGRINISRNTWELVHDLFPTESRGMLSAKNKGEMEMFFIA